jgi:hypothetical protein
MRVGKKLDVRTASSAKPRCRNDTRQNPAKIRGIQLSTKTSVTHFYQTVPLGIEMWQIVWLGWGERDLLCVCPKLSTSLPSATHNMQSDQYQRIFLFRSFIAKRLYSTVMFLNKVSQNDDTLKRRKFVVLKNGGSRKCCFTP